MAEQKYIITQLKFVSAFCILAVSGYFFTSCQEKKVKSYYNSGELLEEYEISDSLKDGRYRSFYKSGNVFYEGNFEQGIHTGKHYSYYDTIPKAISEIVLFDSLNIGLLKYERYDIYGIPYKKIKYVNDFGFTSKILRCVYSKRVIDSVELRFIVNKPKGDHIGVKIGDKINQHFFDIGDYGDSTFYYYDIEQNFIDITLPVKEFNYGKLKGILYDYNYTMINDSLGYQDSKARFFEIFLDIDNCI